MLPTLEHLQGETSPAPFRPWLEERSDRFEVLESNVANWISSINEARQLFRKHVYENPEPAPFDFRQHRASLLKLLASGDSLIIEFCELQQPERVEKHVLILEEKIAGLMEELFQWHMPAGFADDVPGSFKKGMKEAMEGKLVDFPSARE